MGDTRLNNLKVYLGSKLKYDPLASLVHFALKDNTNNGEKNPKFVT